MWQSEVVNFFNNVSLWVGSDSADTLLILEPLFRYSSREGDIIFAVVALKSEEYCG